MPVAPKLDIKRAHNTTIKEESASAFGETSRGANCPCFVTAKEKVRQAGDGEQWRGVVGRGRQGRRERDNDRSERGERRIRKLPLGGLRGRSPLYLSRVSGASLRREFQERGRNRQMSGKAGSSGTPARPWQDSLHTAGQALNFLLASGTLSDVTLMVGREGVPVLEDILLLNTTSKSSVVTLKDDSPSAFYWLLNHIYADKSDISDIDLALQVLGLADKYMVASAYDISIKVSIRKEDPSSPVLASAGSRSGHLPFSHPVYMREDVTYIVTIHVPDPHTSLYGSKFSKEVYEAGGFRFTITPGIFVSALEFF
ncbi:hypothetical protein O3P69_011379 [Scylla paramamosain]|uniref:BTB domain-containing protein n=1 Tax=Scylla paramamosain TaxID=85552 RepID=A0AAW0T664_SCYPA